MLTLALKVVPLAAQEVEICREDIKLLTDDVEGVVEPRLAVGGRWRALGGRPGWLEVFVLCGVSVACEAGRREHLRCISTRTCTLFVAVDGGRGTGRGQRDGDGMETRKGVAGVCDCVEGGRSRQEPRSLSTGPFHSGKKVQKKQRILQFTPAKLSGPSRHVAVPITSPVNLPNLRQSWPNRRHPHIWHFPLYSDYST